MPSLSSYTHADKVFDVFAESGMNLTVMYGPPRAPLRSEAQSADYDFMYLSHAGTGGGVYVQGGGGYSRAAGEVVLRFGGLRVYPHPASSNDAPELVWEQWGQDTSKSRAAPLHRSGAHGGFTICLRGVVARNDILSCRGFVRR